MRKVKPENLRRVRKLRVAIARYMVKQIDVAAEMGVSVQYVNNVLRELNAVSEKQLDRIEAAIEKVRARKKGRR